MHKAGKIGFVKGKVLPSLMAAMLTVTMMPAGALTAFAEEADPFAGATSAPSASSSSAASDAASSSSAASDGASPSSSGSSLVAAPLPEPEKVAIAFDKNADGVEGEMEDAEFVLDGKQRKLPACAFEREGYAFAGWSTTKDGKDVADDPETKDVDESFEARFVPDAQAFEDLGYTYEEEQADGKSKTVNADLTYAVKDGKVTLYAQWEQLPESEGEAAESGDAAGKSDEPSSKSEEAAAKSEGAASKSDEAASKSGDAAGSEDAGKAESDASAKPKTKVEEPEPEATASVDGELLGVTVSDIADEGVAATALEDAGLEAPVAKQAARQLFAAPAKAAAASDDMPWEADGSSVTQLNAKWITEDTVDNGADELLYLKPGDDEKQEARLRISYAMSGEKDYAPGDVVITIPASMFTDRDGNVIGKLVVPYPEEPGTKGEFNWKQVGDEIQIVNTKRMKAATQGFVDIAFTDLTPHVVKDMQRHEWTGATIEVTTWAGNVIGRKSAKLYCEVDTAAEVQSASKERNGTIDVVKSSDVPASARVDGEDEYVRVHWYTWAYVKANQTFDLDYADTVTDAYASATEGHAEGDAKAKSGNVYSKSFTTGKTRYDHFYVYYPFSQFEPDTDYTFTNSVTYTLTETDPEVGSDPRQVTSQTATAQAIWSYHLPVFKVPTGHFMVYKMGNDGDTWSARQGASHRDWEAHRLNWSERIDSDTDYTSYWYGVYPNALNRLRDGEDVEIGYTSQAVGYLLPWTLAEGADARLAESYNQRSVTMTVDEDGLDNLEVGVDYDWTAVDFGIDPWIAKLKAINVNPDGSFTAVSAGDGTFEYQTDYDESKIPQLTLSIERDGAWEDYATVDYTTGTCTVTLADGTAVEGTKVALPGHVTDIRVSATTNVAALIYRFRPMATLHASSPKVQAIADFAFANGRVPSHIQYNQLTMTAERADTHEDIVSITKRGYDQLMGYTTDVSIVPRKSSTQGLADIDYDEGVVTVHYAAMAEERTTITDLGTYRQALEDGAILEETRGVWRDLLPKGMVPDLASIKLRSGDKVERAYTLEDYEGSGRTLLVVEATLVNAPQQYTDKGLKYWEDVPSIRFDATYSLENVINYGDELHNVVSFESGNPSIGTVRDYSGEPDDPRAGNNVATRNAFADDAERDAMTDLDKSSDKPAFVYAGTWTNLDLLGRGTTSLSKEVDVNNEGAFSTGTYDDERTVYEGGQYTYRLTMLSNIGTTSKDMILYDTLENFHAGQGNDEADIDAPRWQGSLRKVDVSQLESLGVAPVVYYSTEEGLELEDAEEREVNSLDTAPEKWVRADAYAGDVADVKAVAVDLRKKADGSDFELPEGESVVVLLQMRAPWGDEVRDYVEQDAHAYNNAFLKATSVDNETLMEDREWIRKDYTKVGIEEMEIDVEKKWADDGDRDGKRPDSVTMRLYADDADTGRAVVLDEGNGWKSSFEHVPYTDEDGDKVIYSVREDAVEGYASSVDMAGLQAVVTNSHEFEKVRLSGEKTWVGDEGAEGARPQSILVTLYADGQRVASRTVRGESGAWKYDFGELPRYRDGGIEIAYTVDELRTGALESYVMEADGLDIVNTYHPYGELTVAKRVDGATEGVAGKRFAFTFSFADASGEPVFDEFAYDVVDADGNVVAGRSGKVATDGTVELAGGETAVVHEIPQGTAYTVTEAAYDGWTMTQKSGDTGTVKPNATASAEFANTYRTEGAVQLQAAKSLTGRAMTRYQFRFELYDVTGLSGAERETGGELVRAATNAADGTVTFGALRYGNADDGKTYTYRIQETDRGKPGYTYDGHVAYVDVAVSDDGDGTMTATPTVEGGVETVYVPATVDEAVSGDVELFGHVGDGYVALGHRGVDGAETWGYMDGSTFREYDLAEGVYKAVERTAASFANAYHAEGAISLKAWKQLEGRQLADGEFSFEMTEVDENGDAVEGGVRQVKANDGNGEVAWDEIAYDQDDAGKTFHYKMTELAGSDQTVVYDTSAKYYDVTVTDNGDGTLSCTTASRVPSGKLVAYDRPMYLLVLVSGDVSGVSGKPSDTADDMCWMCLVKADEVDGQQMYYKDRISEETFEPGTSIAEMAAYHGFELVADDGAFDPADYDGQLTAIRFDGEGHDRSALMYNRQPAYELTDRVGADEDVEEAVAPIFHNTLKPGDLVVQKRVTDDSTGYPEDQTFRFRVELGDPSTEMVDGMVEATKVSHTNNMGDDGVATRLLNSYETKTDTVTLSGAEQLQIDVWYSTYGTNYSWLAIYGADQTPTTTNYGSAAVSKGKLGGGAGYNSYAKPTNSSYHKTYTVDGDTVKFYFRVNGSGAYYRSGYGYYATVTGMVPGEVEAPTAGSVEIDTDTITFSQIPTAMVTPIDLCGAWDAFCGFVDDVNPFKVERAYAAQDDIASGNYDGVDWRITWDGDLVIGKQGETQRFVYRDSRWNYPWKDYKNEIGSIRFEGAVEGDGSMARMFSETKAATIDLTGFDTSDVIDMEGMFVSSNRLEKVNLGDKFDTSKVTSMKNMFRECYMLRSLDLGDKFDTSNVTTMYYMFYNCNNLVSLNLGDNFDTSNVTDMISMFYNCQSLTSLDLGDKFDTSKLTYIGGMFNECRALRSIDLGDKFDTSNVTNMSSMFYNCNALTSLDLGDKFDTSNVTSMSSMFSGCNALASLDLGDRFDTSNVTSMYDMFCNCNALASLDLGDKFDTSNATNMGSMFSGCRALTSLDLGDRFDTSNVTNMHQMFYSCKALESIQIPPVFSFKGNNITSTSNQALLPTPPYTGKWVRSDGAYGPYAPEELRDGYSSYKAGTWVWETYDGQAGSDVVASGNYDGVDWRITAGGELVIGKAGETQEFADRASRWSSNYPWSSYSNYSSVRFEGNVVGRGDMSQMFYNRYNLASVDFENFDTSNVTKMYGMFSYCYNLVSINMGEKFDTSNVTDMCYMFSYCERLRSLDLGDKFDTSNVTNMQGMFSYCTSLIALDLGDKFDTSNVTSMSSMFSGCNALASLDLGDRFDTSKVADMGSMFYNCYALTSLDLGDKFDTSNVTSMSYMFYGCNALESIDLGDKFDTSKVTGLNHMFYDCRSLASLDVSGFDTSNVTNMTNMFYGCAGITFLDMSSFDTSKASTSDMFPSSLSRVELGPKWQFKSSSSGLNSYGKWYRVGGVEGPMTVSELTEDYDEGMAGTWVWLGLHRITQVSYDPNGGMLSGDRRVESADEEPSFTLPEPTRPGFEFAGWTLASDGGGEVLQAGSEYEPVYGSATTLHAKWVKDNYVGYTVRNYLEKADGDGYELAETISYAKMGEPGSSVEVTPRAIAGYKTPEAQTVELAADGSATVDFHYDRNRYNVFFEPNGADMGWMDPLGGVAGGTAFDLPANLFSWLGHVFLGWNTSPDGEGDGYSDGERVSDLGGDGEDVSLYARWSEAVQEPASTTGEYTVRLKGGQSVEFVGLPHGTEYTIEEVNVPLGWEQEGAEGGSGTIEVNTTKSASVTNRYSADGEAEITVRKAFEGGTLKEGMFTFELLDESGKSLGTAVNGYDLNGDGAVAGDEEIAAVRFDALQYTQPGTYRYKVREVPGDDGRTVYDDSEVAVTVLVADAGHGNLVTDVEYMRGDDLFENSIGTGELTLAKSVEGATDVVEDQAFTFDVELRNPDGTPYEGSLTLGHREAEWSTYNIGPGGEKLSDYEMNRASAGVLSIPGAESLHLEIDYSYVRGPFYIWQGVRDDIVALDGQTSPSFDSSSVYYTGPWNGSGDELYHLSLDVPGDTVTLFTWSYAQSQSYSGYNEWTNYGAHVRATADLSMPVEDGHAVYTVKGGGSRTIAGLPDGTAYTVTERDIPGGWEQVASEGATGTVEVGKTSSAFVTNRYSTSGIWTPKAVKSLAGADLEDGQYSFEIVDGDGTVVSTGTNDADGNVAFGPVPFTGADHGKTYTYTMREVAGDEGNTAYDSHEAQVVVRPVDNGDGTMTVMASYDGGTTFDGEVGAVPPEFSNEKLPDVKSVAVAKSWKEHGRAVPWPSGVTVTAVLYADGEEVSRATLTEDAPTATFANLPAKDGERDIVYTVDEVVPEDAQWEKASVTSAGGDGTLDRWVIVNNAYAPVELPLTGGEGLALGLVLALVAAGAAGFAATRRRHGKMASADGGEVA